MPKSSTRARLVNSTVCGAMFEADATDAGPRRRGTGDEGGVTIGRVQIRRALAFLVLNITQKRSNIQQKYGHVAEHISSSTKAKPCNFSPTQPILCPLVILAERELRSQEPGAEEGAVYHIRASSANQSSFHIQFHFVQEIRSPTTLAAPGGKHHVFE